MRTIPATDPDDQIVKMYYGLLADLPAKHPGWQLADGTNGTPNLTDRFILGVAAAEDPGATGGAHSVALSLAQLPAANTGAGSAHGHTQDSHGHTLAKTTVTAGSGDVAMQRMATPGGSAGQHSAGATTTATATNQNESAHIHPLGGSGNTHENRPAFYKLAYIVKTP